MLLELVAFGLASRDVGRILLGPALAACSGQCGDRE
jgi:hypothetical protein